MDSKETTGVEGQTIVESERQSKCEITVSTMEELRGSRMIFEDATGQKQAGFKGPAAANSGCFPMPYTAEG